VYASWEILHGRVLVGFLALVYQYTNALSGTFDELANVTHDITIAKYSFARVKKLFNEPARTSSEDGKIKLEHDWKEIKIENLTFQYGDNVVLSDVSFRVKRGEKIGIVGLSGAGKSTLFKLLLKEYEDYKGVIKFDDLSLRDISPRDYYTHTAVVLQETEVFNFSLKDNVTIGKDKFDGEAFERALDVSHVRGFLHKLKNGVETVIGEKGVKLSGGEKQRLGIARAVYKSPELLLMDEATSHLDIESEKTIQDSLHEFFESVTAIVIAHRLTTIKEMDRIIVIEEGKIVEEGSFSKLMRTSGGRFKELWNKQKI
jgi:ABC-type multidrug transport system fused ATPase/permease subunit